MKYSVIPIPKFKKEANRLLKKYPSLKNELILLNRELEINPQAGTPLGFNTYKIRLSIQSKGKCKSGGTRVITYVITDDKEVFLLTIYDKSESDTIDTKTLKQIVASVAKGNK